MKQHGSLAIAAACAAFCATPSDAADLALEGNEAGCAFVASGDFGDDRLVVLKADGLETFVMACEWVGVATAKDGAQVATGLCSHEGEDYRSVETFIVAPHPTDRAVMRISAHTGETWNEVKQCR